MVCKKVPTFGNRRCGKCVEMTRLLNNGDIPPRARQLASRGLKPDSIKPLGPRITRITRMDLGIASRGKPRTVEPRRYKMDGWMIGWLDESPSRKDSVRQVGVFDRLEVARAINPEPRRAHGSWILARGSWGKDKKNRTL